NLFQIMKNPVPVVVGGPIVRGPVVLGPAVRTSRASNFYLLPNFKRPATLDFGLLLGSRFTFHVSRARIEHLEQSFLGSAGLPTASASCPLLGERGRVTASLPHLPPCP